VFFSYRRRSTGARISSTGGRSESVVRSGFVSALRMLGTVFFWFLLFLVK
jgi:hypothetical protein